MVASFTFTDDSSNNDPDLDILTKFHEEWERAPEEARAGVEKAYCEKYPQIVRRLRDFVHSLAEFDGLKNPERLGPYTIRGVIGIGGMGKVFEAEDQVLKHLVAVKTIRLGPLAPPDLVDRFRNERESLAQLHHTNIVPIFGAGEEAGYLYFAMPRLRGVTLGGLATTSARLSSRAWYSEKRKSWEELVELAESDEATERTWRLISASSDLASGKIRAKGSRSTGISINGQAHQTGLPREYRRQVVEILAVAAEAIHSVHEAGFVHRDIKPSNILVERLGHPGDEKAKGLLLHPWVLDFGLAHHLAIPDHSQTDFVDSTYTIALRSEADFPSRGLGTRGYMAPENVIREAMCSTPDAKTGSEGASPGASHAATELLPVTIPAIDRYSDVWSLGATLYQLLTFRLPFENDAGVLAQAGPIPPRELVPDLPHELEAICLKALEKNHARRYQTAAEFAAELRRWLDGRPTHAGKAGLSKRAAMWAARRPAAAIAGGMATAFLIALAVAMAFVFQAQRAQANVARAEADVTRGELALADQRANAKQRQLDLLALERLRAPIRRSGWFEKTWAKVRTLSAGGPPDDEGRLQGRAVVSLIGIDARIIKSIDKAANMLAFDPTGKRLLMAAVDGDEQGSRLSHVNLWDELDPMVRSQEFQAHGVVAFPAEGAPMMLFRNEEDRQGSLSLKDALTGEVKRSIRSPLAGPSRFTAIALSRDGTHAAGMVWPTRAENRDDKPAQVPDGDTATIAAWNTATGDLVREWKLKPTPESKLVLSPDGALVAVWDTLGQRNEVEVWSVADGRRIAAIPAGRTMIASVAFGRDPVWHNDDARTSPWCLAVGMSGSMVTVWDLRSRSVRSLCRGSAYEVSTLDFSPDGALLASAGRGEIRLWNTATGACVLVIPGASYQSAVAFSPDGRRLAVEQAELFGGSTGSTEVQVFELDTGRGMLTLSGLEQRIEKFVVSADGRRVAALSNDWRIGVWDRTSGALIAILDAPVAHFPDNTGLGINADGSRFFCSAGTEAKLWDLKAGRLLGRWSFPPGLTECPAFRADGRLILVREETRTGKPPFREFDPRLHPRVCRLYELPVPDDPKVPGTPRRIAEIGEFDKYVYNVDIAPDGSHFAIEGIGTATGRPVRFVRLYEGLTGKQVGALSTISPPTNTWNHLYFVPNGTRLKVALDHRPEANMSVFEVPSLRLFKLLPNSAAAANETAFRWVTQPWSTDDESGSLLVHEEGNPRPLLRIVPDAQSGVIRLRLSPDGNRLTWGAQDGTVIDCDLVEVQKRLAGVGLGW